MSGRAAVRPALPRRTGSSDRQAAGLAAVGKWRRRVRDGAASSCSFLDHGLAGGHPTDRCCRGKTWLALQTGRSQVVAQLRPSCSTWSGPRTPRGQRRPWAGPQAVCLASTPSGWRWMLVRSEFQYETGILPNPTTESRAGLSEPEAGG